MTLRRIDQLMLKLMDGTPLTEGERINVAEILAAWDAAQPRETTGRPKGNRSRVALHYWALRRLRRDKAAVAEIEVGEHWGLAPRTVREIGEEHSAYAKKTLAAFVTTPDAFIRSCERFAKKKLAEK